MQTARLRRPRRLRRPLHSLFVVVVAVVGVVAAFSSRAQEQMSIRERADALRLLTSPDGAFRVGAATEALRPHRFAVLNLCRTLRQRLAAATGIKTSEEDGIIVVLLGGDKKNDEGITIARGDFYAYHIELAEPETVDAELLAGVLARCVLNNWLESEQRKNNAQQRGEVPLWFARGLANYLEASQREADFEAVETLMMAGRLRPLAELLEDGGGNTQVSATLVAWLLETGGRNAYLRLQDALAKGAAWSGALLRETLAQTAAAQAQESWDFWLHKNRRKVFNPGATGAGVWTRLRQLVYVYPVDLGWMTGDVQRARSFAELVEMESPAWRKRAAEERMMALRTSVPGRDQAYREVIEAYCDFLTAVAKNEKPDNLRAKLSIAEARHLAAYATVMGLNKGREND